MTANQVVILPDDSGNAGKNIRTNIRNVTLNTGATANVNEHYLILVGQTTGNVMEVAPNNQGNVTTRSALGLTANTPASASVQLTSGTVIAANAARTGFICYNLSSNHISLGFGQAAVLNRGVTI